MVDYANYLRPQHPTPWEARRWRRKIIFKPISKALKRSKFANSLIGSNMVFFTLKRIERLIPPDPAILRWLEDNRPDVVVASPYILPGSAEIDYIQAAGELKIPTVAIVLSWDNLTTKGTFHRIPDAVLVWNDALRQEAVTIHGVPSENIYLTGAPVFDFWSEMKPTLSYEEFCSEAGLDPGLPYILYLCSSKYISGDETEFVGQIGRTITQNKNQYNANILVRPHPLNTAIWENAGNRMKEVTLWPHHVSWVDTVEAKQAYFNSIYHSRAVIGVNTSAFLEAALLDRPCLTFMSEHHRDRQSERGHFRHLLNADFLEVTRNQDELAAAVGRILSGRDSRKEQREKFVSDFIRPHGMQRKASEIMATAIESASAGEITAFSNP
jgi:hypothetical protein